jgi:Fur family ferric uptake transcriptional regulator
MVLDAVLDMDGHFDVDELYVKLLTESKRVSKATVYRTLAILSELGLIKEHAFGERHQHYERLVGRRHHDHMVCARCGRIIEFVDPAIERLQDKVCRRHGFVPAGHHLSIEGTCADCAAKAADSGGADEP